MHRVTLQLGQADTRPRLLRAGVRLNAYAEQIFADGMEVGGRRTIHLHIQRLADLGLPRGATLDALLAQVLPDRLVACPLVAAVELRLVWPTLPIGPRITVVSPRWRPAETEPRGFYLRDDAEGPWLRAYRASDDWVFAPEEVVALMVAPAQPVREGSPCDEVAPASRVPATA